MTTWTTISNAAVAVGAIPSSSVVTALRDNPSAVAESSSGAPVMVSGWHPYNKVRVGDGVDGVIHDFSVHGALTTITSPDFVDGYEYRFFGKLGSTFIVQLYNETDAAYMNMQTSFSGLFETWFQFELLTPRVAHDYHMISGAYARTGTNSAVAILSKAPANTLSSSSKILRLRFSGGTSSSGDKIWMFRRREYASSP